MYDHYDLHLLQNIQTLPKKKTTVKQELIDVDLVRGEYSVKLLSIIYNITHTQSSTRHNHASVDVSVDVDGSVWPS